MSQSDFGNITSPQPGADFFDNKLEPWRDALHTLHRGNTRPSYVQSGMMWIDDSATPWSLKVFQGSDDIVMGTLDPSTLVFVPSGSVTLEADGVEYDNTLSGLVAENVQDAIDEVVGTKQPLDATLTALAGLTTGANKIPYSTGTDTFGQLDFKDEDDMASDSATAVPSQQSVKAYVDTNGRTNYLQKFSIAAQAETPASVGASATGFLGNAFAQTNGASSSAIVGSSTGHYYHLSTGTASTGRSQLGLEGPFTDRSEFNPSDLTFSLGGIMSLEDLSNGTNRYEVRFGCSTDYGIGISDQNGVFFRYVDNVNGGRWQCVTRSGGVETATNSGIAVAADTAYKLEIHGNATGTSMGFYINGSLVATNTTNIPTITTMKGIGSGIQKAAGSTSRSMYVTTITAESKRP